ncbi:MAG: hypothetical protein AB7S26_10850 [Sandaracinaceae bacterium]
MRSWTLALALLALPLAGCVDEEPLLVLGVGEGTFHEFGDGDTLDLVSGCQGSQHVWTAIRTRGLTRTRMLIDLSFTRVRDDVLVSAPFVVRASLEDGPDGYEDLAGLTLQIPIPGDAIGEDLLMRGEVTDAEMRSASDERMVRVDWGVGGCR